MVLLGWYMGTRDMDFGLLELQIAKSMCCKSRKAIAR